MEEELITTKKYQVTSVQSDYFGRLRLGSLLNLMIDAATENASSLGFGFEDLGAKGLIWVLSRMHLQVDRPLKMGEEISIQTWPKNILKILFVRDFLIQNAEGETVGKATSGWFAVDTKTGKAALVDGRTKDRFIKLKDRHGIIELPGRLSAVTSGETVNIRPTFFDLDFNKHVTTSRYADWMMDQHPLEFHREHFPSEVQINFIKEIKPEEEVQLSKQESENGFLYEGTKRSAGEVAFRGEVLFEKVEDHD